CLTVSNGDGSFGPPGLRIGTPTAVGISRYTPCWSMQPAERVEHDPHLSPQNPNRRSRRCITQHTCHPCRDTHLRISPATLPARGIVRHPCVGRSRAWAARIALNNAWHRNLDSARRSAKKGTGHGG